MEQLGFTRLTSHYDPRYASDTLERVLRDPDATLTGTTPIKHDGTTTVWEITIDLHRCIIKRYNRKTPVHGIRRFFSTLPCAKLLVAITGPDKYRRRCRTTHCLGSKNNSRT